MMTVGIGASDRGSSRRLRAYAFRWGPFDGRRFPLAKSARVSNQPIRQFPRMHILLRNCRVHRSSPAAGRAAGCLCAVPRRCGLQCGDRPEALFSAGQHSPRGRRKWRTDDNNEYLAAAGRRLPPPLPTPRPNRCDARCGEAQRTTCSAASATACQYHADKGHFQGLDVDIHRER